MLILGCKEKANDPIEEIKVGFDWEHQLTKNKGFIKQIDSLATKIESVIYGNIDEIFVS